MTLSTGVANWRRRFVAVGAASLISLSLYAAETGVQHGVLLRAIQQGDARRVEMLLEQGTSPNVVLPDGSTPLAWAVDAQHQQMVTLLLAQGADPNLEDEVENAVSPLLIACARGDTALVDLLLDAGADADRATPDGITPMALCAGYADSLSLSLLADQGAAVNRIDDRGQTPLMHAAAAGGAENVRWLIEKGADLNAATQSGFSALLFGIKSGDADTATLLIDAGADQTQRASDGTTVVQLAMYWQQYEVAGYLINKGADLKAYDRNGNQLLHAAVLAGQQSLIEQLVEAGADVNAPTGESKVVWRYEANFTAAPYIAYPKTPLVLAAEKGSAAMMDVLLAAGADPSFVCDDGSTILHAAAQSTPDALSLAIARSDDVNIQTTSGDTALHRLLTLGTDKATTSEEIAIMLTLLAGAGASTDIENASGATAYSIASSAQHRSRADFLNAFGINPEENL
ncbi:MAG: ankyrin repeat domain-containing protein [Pseudomonadota bacterium]